MVMKEVSDVILAIPSIANEQLIGVSTMWKSKIRWIHAYFRIFELDSQFTMCPALLLYKKESPINFQSFLRNQLKKKKNNAMA